MRRKRGTPSPPQGAVWADLIRADARVHVVDAREDGLVQHALLGRKPRRQRVRRRHCSGSRFRAKGHVGGPERERVGPVGGRRVADDALARHMPVGDVERQSQPVAVQAEKSTGWCGVVQRPTAVCLVRRAAPRAVREARLVGQEGINARERALIVLVGLAIVKRIAPTVDVDVRQHTRHRGLERRRALQLAIEPLQVVLRRGKSGVRALVALPRCVRRVDEP
mmetsp:Transcript_17370/g.55352  ORF Transcript_17370/g.55352 Transcript_17370/m.55352 type:complete len:223 (+) Transcript_17370:391-1059(+)